MKKLLSTLLLVVSIQTLAFGQSRQRKVTRRGYVFFSVGATAPHLDGTLGLGFGVEDLITDRFAAGMDLGFTETFGGTYGEQSFPLSWNGSYTFNPQKRLNPFFFAGPTLFAEGALGYNLGGGLNYWVTQDTGIRLELRNLARTHVGDHFWGLRIALVAR